MCIVNVVILRWGAQTFCTQTLILKKNIIFYNKCKGPLDLLPWYMSRLAQARDERKCEVIFSGMG